MRIVHLSVCRQFSRGQLNQLQYEHNAAKSLEESEWTTVGYHAGPTSAEFIRTIPFLFRGIFLRNLYGWLVALKFSRSHDIVLMRHMTFDPFALIFAPLIPNRVSIHHAKEVEELRLIRQGWKGRLASVVEQICGKFAVRKAKMILGVTNEIAEYERELRCPLKPTGTYPNGVEVNSINVLTDLRKPDELNVVFICGLFSPWHGLDRLLKALKNGSCVGDSPIVHIHLIGSLSEEQVNQIELVKKFNVRIVKHGVMESHEYHKVMAMADFGIGSLAMDRQNLNEGSTLKIREMLALGLPVYSGHADLALPQSVPWAKVVEEVSLTDLIDFGISVKKIDRMTVREQSSSMIEKSEIMKRTVSALECQNLFSGS